VAILRGGGNGVNCSEFYRIKIETMSAQELKTSIQQLIEKENDEAILKAIKDVIKSIVSIKKNQVVGYDVDGNPLTRGELEKIVVASSENAKKGNVISHEDLLKQMENW
jgi:hypothetical protein